MDLSRIKTCELVSELKKREGVKKIVAEPYQIKDVSEEGPTIILVITD